MPADVVERVDGRCVAAHDDDGLIADLEQEVIALVAHPVDVAGDEPFAAHDLFHVRGKDGVVAVELAVQAVAQLGARGQRARTG